MKERYFKISTESDDGHVSNKHAKAEKVTVGRSEPSLVKNNSISSQNLTALSKQYGELKSHNQLSVSSITFKKKSCDTRVALDSSSYLKVPNGDHSVPMVNVMDIENLKMGILQ
ncbi:hypothetical protein V6N13_001872 [Hibiscus sabdariffa]|uniref:Uncharacterized protein n=1 Tax=Hibiscus sabdariffa TaxID=183260 RepID=A0ABR2G9L2_9ROSI